jgi:hypothetical protein
MVRVPSKEEFHGLFDPVAERFRDVSLVWPPAARGYINMAREDSCEAGPSERRLSVSEPFCIHRPFLLVRSPRSERQAVRKSHHGVGFTERLADAQRRER